MNSLAKNRMMRSGFGTRRRAAGGAWAGAVLLALALAGARGQSTAPVSWSAKDAQGQAVTVPTKKISLLVFLRPGQVQTQEEIKLLAGILKGREDVALIGVVSGDDAGPGAAKLAADASWPGAPVVLDGQYAASGRFSVRVWPTTVIIDPAGAQVAHLPGLPMSLENDLAAYLDFAEKKIDRGTLQKRLADREVVADSQDQKAARHVETAQRLAEKGMSTEASRELASALALSPKDPAVLLSIARTELVVGDAKAAEDLLGKLSAQKSAEVPAAQINQLKGWCAVAQEQWDAARTILLENEKLNPDPAETFYLLGRVFEHDGDTKKAAEYYRKAFEHSAMGKGMGT